MAPTTRSMTAKANSQFNTPSSLLGLPGGVENLLLSFVSSGKGGLCDVLNLRAVCKTTHSWVDNLPKRQADVIFSNAKVKVGSHYVNYPLRFLDYPPPYGVTALSLGANHLYPFVEVPRNEWDLWTRLYALWSPRVEKLEVWDECFRCLSTRPSLREHFYSQLEGMSKLQKLAVPLFDLTDFALIRKFIEFKDQDKNNDTRLQIHLTLIVEDRSLSAIDGFYTWGPVNIGDSNRCREELRNFAACVVSSNLEIQLQMDRDGIIPRFNTFVPREIFLDLCKLVVSIEHLELTGDLLNLRDIFPKLRNLEYLKVNPSVDIQQMTFPASLEKFGVFALPPFHRLPAALTSLSFCNNSVADEDVNVGTLFSSLTPIDQCCPSLETLNICWGFQASREPIGNFVHSPRFPNLRSLAFTGDIEEKANFEAGRLAILSGFQWDQMKLNYLALSFKADRNADAELPVVGVELLTKILEGPMAKTLLRVGLRNDVVTLEGLPLLQKLRSLAAENWKQREAMEGRGEWCQHSFPRFVERNLRLGT